MGKIVPRTQTGPPAKLVKSGLAAEQRAFQRERTKLMRRYAGQYVAFYGGRVADHDKDDEALAARMFAKFGEVPFHIAQVEAAISIYEVPSPELAG